jgi:hypothetical protein
VDEIESVKTISRVTKEVSEENDEIKRREASRVAIRSGMRLNVVGTAKLCRI